jgi:hypothetical protein
LRLGDSPLNRASLPTPQRTSRLLWLGR